MKSFTKNFNGCTFFYLIQQILKFLQTVRKAIGKFDASVFIVFEKMREAKLICRPFTLLLLLWTWVGYSCSSSPPLWTNLLCISVTYFHALVIKTCAFFESLYYKMSLPSDSFNAKVKPSWLTVRVRFFFEVNHKDVASDHFYCRNVATLKITLENNGTKRNNFSELCLNFVTTSADLLWEDLSKDITLFFDQLQFLAFMIFGKILFAMLLKWGGRNLLGKYIGKYLLFYLLELTQTVVVVGDRIHLFLLLE